MASQKAELVRSRGLAIIRAFGLERKASDRRMKYEKEIDGTRPLSPEGVVDTVKEAV